MGPHQQVSNIFNLNTYYARLATKRLGRHCIFLEKVDSTIEVANGHQPDTLVVAGQQLMGRGQGANVWQSPLGCAMASLRMECERNSYLHSRITFLQHILVIAMAKTLEEIEPIKLGKEFIKFKWPNDMMYCQTKSIHTQPAQSQKIAGVLLHSTERAGKLEITLSFGLNLLNSEPTICVRDIVASELVDVSIDSVIASIINKLELYTYGLDEQLFRSLKKYYTDRCLQLGTFVVDKHAGRARVLEVRDDGYLLGERCSDGQQCTISKIIN